ncbi:MAG: response regulator transcription factor [Clostridiales bacterium]|nr:response regulator transcription factor [Clostridiales bacterium]
MSRIMIVEDQQLVRMYLEDEVRRAPDLELKHSITNADLADLYCRNEDVDLILMDVYTEYGASGLEASARIKKAYPNIKIIIITSMPEFSWLERAREYKVDSFVYKELNDGSLVDVIRRTIKGESIYPVDTPEVIIGDCSSKDLSYRELEVLREITTGDSNEEIASRMHLSVSTIKTHITNLMQKTGFRSRTELAIKARESGLVIK